MKDYKKYEFVGDREIPNHYKKDVLKLSDYIADKLDIYLSFYDVYQLWSAVSESWDAGWLNIESHYESQTREEFLMDQIERYCRRVS